MTVTVSLGFDPIWSNFNIFGVSAGGAQLFSYDSLNPTVFKPIYSDPGMNFPYPQPILFDQNGNAPGPFYFTLDSVNPSSLYDLFLYDAQGNLIWNVNSYYPSGGSGGSIDTAINLNNLIVNGVLWRNVGSGTGSTPATITVSSLVTLIAPGTHDALSVNPNPTPSGTTLNSFGPDIQFIKNNTTSTDIISFPTFTLGLTPFSPDITPVDYVDFKTTAAGSSETFKYYQYPINAKVQNLSNQSVTVKLWAKGVSGTQTLSVKLAQFFGDGSAATPTVITNVTTFNLTNSWAPYTQTFTVPTVSGATLGQCGNDGIFLLIGMPLTTTCELQFAKVSLYLGSVAPVTDFVDYDVINGAINTPRTGDIRIAVNNFGSSSNLGTVGWVPMNDGTIGNITSTATTRANIDTFPLYNLLWNSVSQAYAPVDGGTRGANAIADFVANKPISLIKALGRVLAGTLNTEIIKSITVSGPFSPSVVSITVPDINGLFSNVPVIFTTVGSLPGGLSLNTTYYVIPIDSTHISVSLTVSGTAVPLTSAGSGSVIQVAPYQLAQYGGAENELMTLANLVNHTHNVAGSFVINNGVPGGQALGGSGTINTTATTGGVQGLPGTQAPINIIQPTTYVNMFMKL